ncbi:hypothetical protein M231_07785 [Tremella mesenterica]|uniref:NAD-dependent epimerase/dehydratase domain-containing protein n=1 Tax=Tremella mesenterica TaxID=5217 RepID=A0A4Q1BFE0_TREME|nr:hypothetical protein M231_07785 [Tremella mesenterica]
MTDKIGTGLVGSAIRWVIENEPVGTRFGKKEGEKWVFLSSGDCDLRGEEETLRLFEMYKPKHVIHLAAIVGGLFANMSRKLDFLQDNIKINQSVLHSSHVLGVKKVVSCLSTCVFPDEVTYPLTEEKIHAGPPHHSNFGYAYAKRLVDIQNHAYHEQFGSQFTSVIPTNVFGPGDNYDLKDAHVIPSLIHRCYFSKSKCLLRL